MVIKHGNQFFIQSPELSVDMLTDCAYLLRDTFRKSSPVVMFIKAILMQQFKAACVLSRNSGMAELLKPIDQDFHFIETERLLVHRLKTLHIRFTPRDDNIIKNPFGLA